jgi:hypothetical protein
MQESVLEKEEYDKMVGYLIESAMEMDNYSRKLNDYIQNNIKSAVSAHPDD